MQLPNSFLSEYQNVGPLYVYFIDIYVFLICIHRASLFVTQSRTKNILVINYCIYKMALAYECLFFV
jgi:hypothetical protein